MGQNKRTVICDIETEGFKANHIAVIGCLDFETKEYTDFCNVDRDPKERRAFELYQRDVGTWVGHNFLTFDAPAIKKHIPEFNGTYKNIIDTLVVGRLTNYSRKAGHSLDSYGKQLGKPKTFFNDYGPTATPEMRQYCKDDVELNAALYEYFLPWIESPIWKDSLEVEHFMAWMCQQMEAEGFYFDIDTAKRDYDELSKYLSKITTRLKTAFPPKAKFLTVRTPTLTKQGTLNGKDFKWVEDPSDLTAFKAGASFSRVEWIPFNPGSPKQVVARLNEIGWKPFERTKGFNEYQRVRKKDPKKLAEYQEFGWKISEDNLATVNPDAPPAAKELVKWLMLKGRLSTYEQWFKAYNPKTHRIHGTFWHIGSWTHRMSHSDPNMANIPSKDSKYHDPELKELASYWGEKMRSVWQAEPGKVVVGVDASGIQLRVLAHYMNDEDFSKALVQGQSEDGTDVHSLNRDKLGLGPEDRPRAKTFIYAWLLGAGTPKISSILNLVAKAAKAAVEKFINGYPGLKALKEGRIKKDAHRGFFQAIDGRYIAQEQERLILAGYLQSGEACVMKHSLMRWYEKLTEMGLPFLVVNFVHDEWVTETPPEHAKKVKALQIEAIEETGKKLGFNIELTGAGDIGNNWYEVH